MGKLIEADKRELPKWTSWKQVSMWIDMARAVDAVSVGKDCKAETVILASEEGKGFQPNKAEREE